MEACERRHGISTTDEHPPNDTCGGFMVQRSGFRVED